jgi:hypothetical protein
MFGVYHRRPGPYVSQITPTSGLPTILPQCAHAVWFFESVTVLIQCQTEDDELNNQMDQSLNSNLA